jgi:hypothetical protein
LVEAAIAMPIFILIISGFIAYSYACLLLMATINNAGSSLVNTFALNASAWEGVTSGNQLVIAPTADLQVKIGELIESGHYYEFSENEMKGFANVLGGIVNGIPGTYYMQMPGEPLSGVTVNLTMTSEKIPSSDHDFFRANISRYNSILSIAPAVSVYVPLQD